MKLFLDTNVILDHALMRQTGQPLQIAYLLYWIQGNEASAHISSGSFYTIAYILERQGIRGQALRQKLLQYLTMVSVCPVGKESFENALKSSFKDLEDAFQFSNALAENCDYLITSNIADFRPFAKGIIPVLSPLQFVQDVLGKKQGADY